jgi:hypothetical protein
VDAGERAVPARLELGSDEGVGGGQCRGDQLGARVAEQVSGVGACVLGVWPGGRGVGGDDVVDSRVARAVLLAAGVGVLGVDVVGKVAGDGKRRGVVSYQSLNSSRRMGW